MVTSHDGLIIYIVQSKSKQGNVSCGEIRILLIRFTWLKTEIPKIRLFYITSSMNADKIIEGLVIGSRSEFGVVGHLWRGRRFWRSFPMFSEFEGEVWQR